MGFSDTGSECYITKTGKGFMVKARSEGSQFFFFLVCPKASVRDLLDGKKAYVKMSLITGGE